MKTVEPPPNPVPGARIWPMSAAGYRALGDLGLMPKDTELLHGVVYKKMSKSPIHSFLVQWLHDALLQCLPAGLLLRTEQPLSVADSEPEPDLAVVRGRREDFRDEHPTSAELVIEVSMTSHEYDRSKLTVYAEASVKEVWLVLAPEKKIEVHRLPVGDHFTKKEVHGSGGRLVSTALPEFSVELDGLFAR